MERLFLLLASGLGLVAVALGAFGAHGLQGLLQSAEDGERRMQWWQTGVQYQMYHALALLLVAYLAHRVPGVWPRVGGSCFVAGVGIFSGSLYAMTLGAPRWFGAITPLGGLLMLAGWLACGVAAWGMR